MHCRLTLSEFKVNVSDSINRCARRLQTRVLALDRHGAGEVGADDHVQVFLFDTSAGELRGRPIKAQRGLSPSTLEAAETRAIEFYGETRASDR